MRDPSGRFWRVGVPGILFAAAFLLRLLGIGWGLANDLHNQSYHPDELVIWGASQQIEPAKLHFTPGFYNYGTLYLSCLRVTSDMVGAYTGGPPTAAPTDDPNKQKETEALYWAYVSRCHLGGRVLNALAGAGSVVVAFLMMRRFLGRLAGIAAALVLAVAPAHVVHSRFQTVDIFAVFLLALSAYFALRLIHDPPATVERRQIFKDVVLSGAFAGLSAGTKYTGVLGILTLWAVLFLAYRPRFAQYALLGLAACLIAFVVSTPGCVLDFERFRDGLAFEFLHSGSGHGLVFAGTSSGYLFHLGNLSDGMGGLVLLLGLAGLGYAAYRRHVWAMALLAFWIPYYLVIGHAQDKYMRYTFPLDLGIAAGLGYAVSVGHRRGAWGRVLPVVGILGFGGAVAGTIRQTLWMMGIDPRDQAAQFLKANAAQATVGLASDPWYWSPPLFPDSAEPRSVPFEKRMAQMQAAQNPRVTIYMPPDGGFHAFDEHLITDTRPDFVVYSSLESAPLARLQSQSNLAPETAAAVSQYQGFTKVLGANDQLYHTFGDLQNFNAVEDMQYVQPVLLMWKRKP